PRRAGSAAGVATTTGAGGGVGSGFLKTPMIQDSKPLGASVVAAGEASAGASSGLAITGAGCAGVMPLTAASWRGLTTSSFLLVGP
ncbi:hypothetical protein ABTN76_19470, partial [Acinetobacter baumannii]